MEVQCLESGSYESIDHLKCVRYTECPYPTGPAGSASPPTTRNDDSTLLQNQPVSGFHVGQPKPCSL